MIDVLPPRLAERYIYGRLLGEGGFGRVVYARDRNLDRGVAIKLLSSERFQEPLARERFLREARLMARVDSPHVVRLFDHGVEDGQPYIVFEFVRGLDLEERLRSRGGRLPLDEADAIFVQILEGLAAAHAVGVLHRDLKPENVLLEHSGRAVILDFGLAREIEGESLTRTGTVMGTVLYMAPEQMSGKPFTPPGDLYSAALVYYELASGQLPFEGEDAMALYQARHAPLRYGLRHHGVPAAPGLERLVASLLEADPARRPQSADEVLERLRRLELEASVVRPAPLERATAERLEGRPGADEGPAVTSASQVMGSSPPPRWGRHGLLGMGFLLALAGGWGLGRRGPPPPPPGPTEGAAMPRARLQERLRTAAAALAREPEVARAVAITDLPTRNPEERRDFAAGAAREIWQRGYPALWRGVFRRFEIPKVCAALRRHPLDPQDLDAACRLLLHERLLARADRAQPPAFDATDGSGLEALVARVLRVASPAPCRVPAVLAGEETPEQYHRRVGAIAAALSQGGRRLEVLRGEAELFVRGLGMNPRVRPRNLAGVRHVHPVEVATDEGGALIVDVLGPDPEEWHWRSYQVAPSELELTLHPFQGDLVLTFMVETCTWSHQLVLELEGDGPPVLATFPGSALAGGEQEAPPATWWGKTLRLDARVLPPGLRRLKLWVAALQPVGLAEPTVNLGTIWQQVAGPVPEGVR